MDGIGGMVGVAQGFGGSFNSDDNDDSTPGGGLMQPVA